tara:strand:+ start:1292 stop:2206 length:915 start_codon:yes stop_codon:yes gene_type:complete
MPSTHDYKDDKRNKNIQVYLNGQFHHRSKANISVMDSGFLLGDGVWEGIRLYKNVLIHLEDHLSRLYFGAKSISMEIPLSKKELKLAILETIKKNNMETNVHIRLIVSRGIKKTPYQNPKVTISPPTIVIIPEYKKASDDVKKNGITIGTVKTIRDDRVQDPKINSLSKHNCIAACIEANKLGVDEGLMLDPHGFVSTCNSTNFFIVKNNEVWTSTGQYCLNGVTRKSVIGLCKQYNISVHEKNFSLEDVHSSEELFVTGTFAGVIPVVSVDNIIIGEGARGEMTKNLQDWYRMDLENIVIQNG